MEDSPGLEVRALLEGGALRVGLGWGEYGGVGANSSIIFAGAGAGEPGTVVTMMAATAVGVEPTSRGRRRVEHPRLEVVPSDCLNHAWAGERKEMEGMDRGGSLC